MTNITIPRAEAQQLRDAHVALAEKHNDFSHMGIMATFDRLLAQPEHEPKLLGYAVAAPGQTFDEYIDFMSVNGDREKLAAKGWTVGYVYAAPVAQPQEPWLLKTTQDLALHIAKRCYPEVTQFRVLDDLAGVISQIDNMTTGMERKAAHVAQPEREPDGCGHEACDCRGYCQKQAAPVAQPLTDEQIDALANAEFEGYMRDKNDDFDRTFARAIERAHGIDAARAAEKGGA